MRARVALDAQALALVQAILVLGMKRRTAADRADDLAQALVVLHQEAPRGRADEHLDARAAFRALQHRQLLEIVARAADVEGEVAVHAMRAAPDLVGERLLGDRQRIGVRHLEHPRDAAHDRGARAGLQILFLRQAGLAEMHLRVDHAGQDMQALAVDDFGGARAGKRADGGDAPVLDRKVAQALAVLIDDRAGLQDHIVAGAHASSNAVSAGLPGLVSLTRAPYVPR